MKEQRLQDIEEARLLNTENFQRLRDIHDEGVINISNLKEQFLKIQRKQSPSTESFTLDNKISVLHNVPSIQLLDTDIKSSIATPMKRSKADKAKLDVYTERYKNFISKKNNNRIPKTALYSPKTEKRTNDKLEAQIKSNL